jgi:hypothetical protein
MHFKWTHIHTLHETLPQIIFFSVWSGLRDISTDLLNHITMTEDIFAWTKGITPDNES